MGNEVKKLTLEEREELLQRNIWKKSECLAYIGRRSCNFMSNLFKELPKTPLGTNSVWRDDFLALFRTSAEEELKKLQLSKKN